jgi:hypothetical protein
VKIIPGNAPREIVTELKCEIEAIKTREGKCIQVIFPKAAIVESGLILNFREKRPGHAAYFVRRALNHRRAQIQRGERIFVQAYSRSKFKQAVDDSTSINAGDENGVRCYSCRE